MERKTQICGQTQQHALMYVGIMLVQEQHLANHTIFKLVLPWNQGEHNQQTHYTALYLTTHNIQLSITHTHLP